MSTAEDEVEFSLKVMINKEKTKVLFAEADSDFADVLLSFLALPLGTMVRLFKKHYGDKAPVFGSLNSLRKGLANLDNVHLWREGGKMMLLNPRSSLEDEFCKLKLNVYDAQPTKYFTCEDLNCKLTRAENVSMFCYAKTCYCGKSMNREIGLQEESDTGAATNNDHGVFTTKKMSFFISDDLRMVPNTMRGSIIQTLENLGISETYGAEQRIVSLGFNEIMDLLRLSLLSETPLTELVLHKKLVLHKRKMDYPSAKSELNFIKDFSAISLHHKKMIVKVMIQKSTNKLLFAQAEEDFVDFLFSFLTIPLSRAESLLDGNTSLRSIDNLYRSLTNINGEKCLKSEDTKNRLLKPNLPPMFLSKYQIFPITEQTTPELYYYLHTEDYLCTYDTYRNTKVRLTDPKGEGSYVKGPTMFLVSDDLTVTPLCMLSSLSILNELKIPLGDVKEVELHIGLEEALSILRASLTSTCALTEGLMNNPILNKQSKEEQ
ncbi:hypothetical protein BUALT_Bualt03G0210700 [Buddleja alternifolia]|uniref:DUF674 family protein n=1 Tax=Buddleja alternifolia TaxID=168488 RepID=A0AAV6Y6V4_9LAMI|nr:hypothetical protein BUALT_Bualt03G0210700 [Buddleja alternifolia]